MGEIPRVTFKDRLAEIVAKEFGNSRSRAASLMNIARRTLVYALNTDADVRFDTINEIGRALGVPAVVFYRESDGGLVDLGEKDFAGSYDARRYMSGVIRTERIGKKLRRKDWAAVSARSISNYEKENTMPNSSRIDMLSISLGLVPAYLPREVYGIHPNSIGDGIVEIRMLPVGQ